MTDPTTSAECLKAAFRALARGDTAERDRLCERGERLQEAENRAAAVQRVLAVDFYVTAAGKVIPIGMLARAGGAIH